MFGYRSNGNSLVVSGRNSGMSYRPPASAFVGWNQSSNENSGAILKYCSRRGDVIHLQNPHSRFAGESVFALVKFKDQNCTDRTRIVRAAWSLTSGLVRLIVSATTGAAAANHRKRVHECSCRESYVKPSNSLFTKADKFTNL